MLFTKCYSNIAFLQPYLISSVLQHRKALCKFRISAHELIIEKGRYQNIPREHQLYNALKEIEDEMHFLDRYIKYSQIKDHDC